MTTEKHKQAVKAEADRYLRKYREPAEALKVVRARRMNAADLRERAFWSDVAEQVEQYVI